MPAEPYSWTAVVAGAWNLAILSPNGISRRLFQLPEGTPIELQIAVDQPGPFRVIHGGLIVVPSIGRLDIEAQIPSVQSLQNAAQLCARALQSLPETPVSAAGINIRYKFSELPDPMFDLLRAGLDGVLSDAGHEITASVTKRAVSVVPGIVNVQITQEGIGGNLEFNFHKDSTVGAELQTWLGRVEEFAALSTQLMVTLGAGDVRAEINA